MATLYLQFSPRQKKSGLLVFHHKGYTLNVLVMPKLWRPLESRPNPWPFETLTKDEIGKCLFVIAYEGERHIVNNVSKDWVSVFENCSNTLSSLDASEADDDNDLDAETLKRLNSLFSIVSRPSKNALTRFTEYAPVHFDDAFQSLFRLALLCEKKQNYELHESQSEVMTGVSLGEGQYETDIYRLIAIENFLREMNAHLHEVFQGYVPAQEKLGLIRGSVTGRSLMLVEAGLSLYPECRYNKFISDTPLFQVLVSTLDCIERGICTPTSPYLKPFLIELQKRAQHLRYQLSHIRSMAFENARFLSETIQITILQSQWKPALQLAKILLQEKPMSLLSSDIGDGGSMWTIDTSKVWESILEQALMTRNDLNLYPHTNLGQPWRKLKGESDVDLCFESDDIFGLFDAKYKLNIDGSHKGCTKSEEYQLYAYSFLIGHLKAYKNQNIYAGLLYPSKETRLDKVERKGPFRRFQPAEVTSHCELSLFYIPFPSQQHVQDEVIWKRAMTSIGKGLMDEMTDMGNDYSEIPSTTTPNY